MTNGNVKDSTNKRDTSQLRAASDDWNNTNKKAKRDIRKNARGKHWVAL